MSSKKYPSNLWSASAEGKQLNSERRRQGSASFQRTKRILLGNVCVVAIGAALAMTSAPASAKATAKHRKETGHVSKEPFGNISKGPLQIFVSINQQKLHFYSGGVHVVDEPVATGVPGHLTPMGVFSIIERDRYHHSNIYNNAPMPFMERITWSGVALHEGAGLGHQASHGCIRMPHDFAAKLWQLRTMGMRVIIARPELRPQDFADAHLFVHKDRPPPTAAIPRGVETAQAVTPGTKTDVVTPLPVRSSTDTHASAGVAEPAPAMANAAPAAKPASVTPDAAASNDPAKLGTASPDAPKSDTPKAETPKTETPALAEVKTPTPADSKQTQPAAAAAGAEPVKPAEATPAEAVKSTETPAIASGAKPADPAPVEAVKPVEAPVAASGSGTPKPAEPASAEAAKPAASPAGAEPAQPADAAKTEPAKSVTVGATPADTATSARTAPPPGAASTIAPPNLTAPVAATLQQVPLPLAKPTKIVERGSGGPIAIFVSRKEHRIFVRQNFAPLFDAPVTIEHADQPLGTHVFTAMDYLPDHSTFRWTVVTLPGEAPRATTEHWKYVKDGDGHRKRVRVEERNAESAQMLPAPETPKDALARIDIPQDVIDQISQLMVPGSSLVVSDQGLGPETGRGTDFIVITR